MDILIFTRNENGKDVYQMFTRPFHTIDKLEYFKSELTRICCAKQDLVVKGFFYNDPTDNEDKITVDTEDDFLIFKKITNQKFAEGLDQKIRLKTCKQNNSTSEPHLQGSIFLSKEIIKDILRDLEFKTLENPDQIRSRLTQIDQENFLDALKMVYKEDFEKKKAKLTLPTKDNKSQIILVLDTNIFAFYSMDMIEKYVLDNRIRVQLPYIVFRELDDFKGNRKSTQEGEMLRYVGRKSLALINTHMNSRIFVSTPEESVAVELGTQPKKDDIIMFTLKYYREKFGDQIIVVLTRDEGVVIRAKLRNDPKTIVLTSFDDLNEYLNKVE